MPSDSSRKSSKKHRRRSSESRDSPERSRKKKKRERSKERDRSRTPPKPYVPPEPEPKKRKSRWSSADDRISLPGIPAAFAAEMTEEQRKLYMLQLKVEEITAKLRTGHILPLNDDNRSPSPDPIYNAMGQRMNSREQRIRQKMEDERHELIKQVTAIYPDYQPPLDYKPNSNKIIDKVYIPQDSYPRVNFIGLIIGPRGNTLKRLENESNTRIIIRGKGSLKDGKIRTCPLPGEDEPLHALVTSNEPNSLRKAVSLINKIIKDGIECPDGNNELRKMQLRELAELNGTLIGSELTKCRNCGATDHRHWECHEAVNVTNSTVCSKCGGVGHVEMDCKYDGERVITVEEKCKLDAEYQSLMNELGVNSSERTVPSILALPTAVVHELPWASNFGSVAIGNQGGTGVSSQIALPAGGAMGPSIPGMPYMPMTGAPPPPYGMPVAAAHVPFVPAFAPSVISSGPPMAPPPQMPGYWPMMPPLPNVHPMPVKASKVPPPPPPPPTTNQSSELVPPPPPS